MGSDNNAPADVGSDGDAPLDSVRFWVAFVIAGISAVAWFIVFICTKFHWFTIVGHDPGQLRGGPSPRTRRASRPGERILGKHMTILKSPCQFSFG
jgi:hypothetical protein